MTDFELHIMVGGNLGFYVSISMLVSQISCCGMRMN